MLRNNRIPLGINLGIFLGLICLLVSGCIAHADTPVPANQGVITDLAGKLSDPDKQKVSRNLRLFETSRNDKPQFVVLTLKDMPDEGIEEFSRKVFNTWGVGQKDMNNGLLWVWVPSARKYRLEVGRGLESAIPDVESFRAQESIKTLLRQDRGADAIIALSDRLRSDLDPDTAIRSERASGLGIFAGVIAFLAAVFAALLAVIKRKKPDPVRPTPVVNLTPEERYRQASQSTRPARTYPGPSAPPRPTTLKAPPAPSPTPKSSSSSRASDIATGVVLGSILSSGSSSGSSSSSSSSSSSDSSSSYSGGGGSSDGGGSSGDY